MPVAAPTVFRQPTQQRSTGNQPFSASLPNRAAQATNRFPPACQTEKRRQPTVFRQPTQQRSAGNQPFSASLPNRETQVQAISFVTHLRVSHTPKFEGRETGNCPTAFICLPNVSHFGKRAEPKRNPSEKRSPSRKRNLSEKRSQSGKLNRPVRPQRQESGPRLRCSSVCRSGYCCPSASCPAARTGCHQAVSTLDRTNAGGSGCNHP